MKGGVCATCLGVRPLSFNNKKATTRNKWKPADTRFISKRYGSS